MFSQLPPNFPDRILCYYINSTTQTQRACITSIPNWVFERIVFPHQRLLFEALPDALLEIHGLSGLHETLLTQIPCLQLQVHEGQPWQRELGRQSEALIRTDWIEE